jgi:hypothetical protein
MSADSAKRDDVHIVEVAGVEPICIWGKELPVVYKCSGGKDIVKPGKHQFDYFFNVRGYKVAN